MDLTPSTITYEQRLKSYAQANGFCYEFAYTDNGDWEFISWVEGLKEQHSILNWPWFEEGCFILLYSMMNIVHMIKGENDEHN